MDAHLTSASPFLAGLVTSGLIILAYMLFFRFTDFLFAGYMDRRLGLIFALTTFVVGFTQAYFDTTWWFDILQTLGSVIVFMIGTIFAEIKFPHLGPFFRSCLWDYRVSESED